MEILYEDNHIIAVNKSSGEIVQGDKTGDKPLSEILKEYLKEKYQKPGNVFVGVVHRLDRPATGVVVFAKTSKALTRMNEIFRDRSVEKKYWIITAKMPDPPEGRLVHYMIRKESQNKSFVYDREQKDSQRCELEYSLLSKSDRYFFVEVFLHTGRHHQIRAQFAAIGCPVKGDLKYGSPRSNEDGSICLHARSVEFIHPVKQEMVKIVAPVPNDKLWRAFEGE